MGGGISGPRPFFETKPNKDFWTEFGDLSGKKVTGFFIKDAARIFIDSRL